jgi:hypothetical protein
MKRTRKPSPKTKTPTPAAAAKLVKEIATAHLGEVAGGMDGPCRRCQRCMGASDGGSEY